MHHLRTTTAKALISILGILAVCITLPFILRAVAPEWWQGRHVYREEAGQVAEASDFSAANQGQLKNMALAAYEHFLEAIPATLGGIGSTTPPPNPNQPIGPDNQAGTGWKLMKQASQWVVVDFNPADGTGSGKILRRVMNGDIPAEPEDYSITGTGARKIAAAVTTQKDFAAINQGQLKAVAKPYYERLAELFAGFGGYAKPWTDATADDTSFAVASTGQLKNVFAFNRDTDSDGLTDLFELIWGLNFQNAADANARIRGMGMTAAEMFAAGLHPGAGGAPALGDWTLIRRLNLYQDAEYTDADGTWQPIRWDVIPGVTGAVGIQREIEEENWQVVGGIQRRNAAGEWEAAGESVDVSAGAVRIPAQVRPTGDIDYLRKMGQRIVPALNEQYNHRLIGPVTSNESVVQVRLKVLTAGVKDRPRGIRDLVSAGYPPGAPSEFFRSVAERTEALWYDGSGGSSTDTTKSREFTNTGEVFQSQGVFSSNGYLTDGSPWTVSGTYNAQKTHAIYQPPGGVPPLWYDPAVAYTGEDFSSHGTTTYAGSPYRADGTTITDIAITKIFRGLPPDAPIVHLSETGAFTDTDGTVTPLPYPSDTIAAPISYPAYLEGYTTENSAASLIYAKTTTIDDVPGSFSRTIHTITLSGRYDTQAYIADSLATIPAFLPAQGGDVAAPWHITVVAGRTWSERSIFPEIEEYHTDGFGSFNRVVSRRYYNGQTGASEFKKSRYWLECNDCLPAQPVTIVEWSETTSEGAVSGGPAQRTAVNSISITPGSDPGRTTRSPENGVYVVSDVTEAAANETRTLGLLPVELKEVSFDGAKYWELKSDKAILPSTDVVTYTAPHWRDVNGDGKAATNFDDLASGERNFPVAFTRNTKPKVKAKLKIAGLPSGMSVSVRATSPQGPQFPEKTTTVSADGIVEMTEFSESTNPWQNMVRFWSATGSETFTATGDNAFCLDWEINMNGSGWSKVARTKHTVYVTFADPIQTANVLRRETLFNLGCRNAVGGTTPDLIVPAIYSEFTDRLVERVKPSSGERDGDAMEYWATNNDQGATTEDLLEDGTAACGAWARFFIDCLRAQGIDAELSRILPKAQGLTDALSAALNAKYGGIWTINLREDYLYIRNWNIADPFNPMPENGAEAQHNPDPNSRFGDHSVARYGGKIYDPSYGSIRPGGGPFLTLLEWEDASLAAIGTDYKDATRDNGAKDSDEWIFKPNHAATEETTIGPQAWEGD